MSEHGFPRRNPGHERTTRDAPATVRKRVDDPSRGLVSRKSLDVARYVADMSAQLEAMALAADLDLLGYFMGMARAEADLFVRTNAEAGDERDHPALTDDKARNDTSVD